MFRISRFSKRGATEHAPTETGSATKPVAHDASKTTASAAPGSAPPMSLRERKQVDKKLFEEVAQPSKRKSIKTLLDQKADPLTVHGRTGITSVHKATKQEGNLRAILQERPDIDTASLRQTRNSLFSKGKVGETPLQRATRKGLNDSARVLREHESGLQRVAATKDALIKSYGLSAAASRHYANLGKTEDFLKAVDALPEVDCDWDAVSDTATQVFQEALDKAPPCTEKSILFLVLDEHGGLAGPAAAAAAMKKMKEVGKDLPPEAFGFFQEHGFDKAGMEAENQGEIEPLTDKARSAKGRGLCFRLTQVAADRLGIPQNDMEENWKSHEPLPPRDHDMGSVLDRNLSGKVKLGVAFCGAGHGGALNDLLRNKFTVIPISFQGSFIREVGALQPVMPDPADEFDDGEYGTDSAAATGVRKMIDVRMRTAHLLSNPDINVFRVKDGPTMTYDKFLEMKQRLPAADA